MKYTLIEALDQNRRDFEDSLKRTQSTIENNVLALQLLEGEGFKCKIDSLFDLKWPTFTITNPRYFIKIHRALGPLAVHSMSPAGDGRTREVNKDLRPKDEQFSRISFIYRTKLPRGSKCKVKTYTEKRTAVVCNA